MVHMPSRRNDAQCQKRPVPFTQWTDGRLSWLALFGGRRGWLVLLGTGGFVAHQVCEALVPVVIGAVVDNALAPADGAALGVWLAILAGVFMVLAFSWRIGMRLTVRAYSFGSHDLRQLAITRVLDPRGMRHRRAPGEVMSITSSDTDRIAGLAWLVGGSVGAAAAVATTAVALLAISVPLGLAVLVATPLMLTVMHFLSRPLERRSEEEQATAAHAGALATDFVTGMRVLKGLGAEDAAAERYRTASQRSYAAALRAIRAKAAYLGVGTALSTTFLAGIALYAAHLAVAGQLSVGDFVAVVGLAQFVQGPMMRLGFVGVELAQKRGSSRRLSAFLAEAPALATSTGGTFAGGVAAAPAGTAGAELAFANTPLDGLDLPAFTARQGEVVGLVVPDSARAKQLMGVLGFHDPAPRGWITVDGHDVADVDPLQGRSRIFAAAHDASLFTGTVAANLAGRANDSAGAEHRALAASAVSDVLNHLPAGLASHLTNGGTELSGGQRQRLVLGRALHQPQPIIVLHDPSTAVDSVTEGMIAEGLRRFPDKILVLITTSPALLATCDQVIVANVVGPGPARGTHRELLATLTGYRELVQA